MIDFNYTGLVTLQIAIEIAYLNKTKNFLQRKLLQNNLSLLFPRRNLKSTWFHRYTVNSKLESTFPPNSIPRMSMVSDQIPILSYLSQHNLQFLHLLTIIFVAHHSNSSAGIDN